LRDHLHEYDFGGADVRRLKAMVERVDLCEAIEKAASIATVVALRDWPAAFMYLSQNFIVTKLPLDGGCNQPESSGL